MMGFPAGCMVHTRLGGVMGELAGACGVQCTLAGYIPIQVMLNVCARCSVALLIWDELAEITLQ